MGFTAPFIALVLIVVGYASGSSLLFGALRPLISTVCRWIGLQMSPAMVDITAIAIFGCIALSLVVTLWRRSVPSYL